MSNEPIKIHEAPAKSSPGQSDILPLTDATGYRWFAFTLGNLLSFLSSNLAAITENLLTITKGTRIGGMYMVGSQPLDISQGTSGTVTWKGVDPLEDFQYPVLEIHFTTDLDDFSTYVVCMQGDEEINPVNSTTISLDCVVGFNGQGEGIDVDFSLTGSQSRTLTVKATTVHVMGLVVLAKSGSTAF